MDIEDYSHYSQRNCAIFPEKFYDILLSEEWNSYLDIGCGDGVYLKALINKFSISEKNIFAVDFSSNHINNVSKNFYQFSLLLLMTRVFSKKIHDDSIDIIFSNQVIEHVENDNDMLCQINRVLKKGGKAYISTVFKTKNAWYFYKCNGKWALDPTHVREYSSDEQLISKIIKNGLSVEWTNKSIIKQSPIYYLVRMLTPNSVRTIPSITEMIKIPILGYYYWELILKK